jgi:cation diffusion facilitator CzcD-associated flavoprotein CzcO
VVGAGPYGLSVAAHLKGRNVPTRIFGDPLGSWRHNMPAGMFLKSTPGASDLSAPVPGYTLADYCRLAGIRPLADEDPLPIDLFVHYGLWFQRELVPDVERVRVVRVRPRADDFEVVLETGERVSAGTVVIASGVGPFAYLPPELSGAGPLVSHSSQHRDLSALGGRDVLVVGGGQSALETAALLREAGAGVEVIARRPVEFIGRPDIDGNGLERSIPLHPGSALGPGWMLYSVSRWPRAFSRLPAAARLALVRHLLGPAGAWWLRERVVDRIPIRSGLRILGVRADGDRLTVDLQDREGTVRTASADHLIAATGYRVDLARLAFLEPRTRAAIVRTGSFPRLDRSFESSVPGLYFTGLAAAATFGPLLRFVAGTGFAAATVAAAVAARTSSRVPVGA